MTTVENIVKFHDGRQAPRIGLGVWQVEDSDAPSVVRTALQEGYRSIDTAAIYGNERGVGQGIRDSGVPREDIFVATKLWNDQHGHDLSRAAFEVSLEKLGLNYVDLYLIHWPVPKFGKFVQAWEALIQLRDEGRAKSIGVCNFNLNHLQTLLDKTGMLPVVNQIELNPYFQQAELREFHAEHEIVTEAWSPLGRGRPLEDGILKDIARKHNRTVAQVILRWHVQIGNMTIPKSVTPSRIKENFQLFDFSLDDSDMKTIATLDRGEEAREGPDPARFSLPKTL
jgi:2,5-diketo-D-gluconate reductase A